MSNGKELWIDCKKKTSTSPNHKERPLNRKTGCGTTERERERDRWTERERKRECVMKHVHKSLIDVENVETTGEMCCHLS